MNHIKFLAVPIALLMNLPNLAYGGVKTDPNATIHRLCSIQANFPTDASVVAITMEDICAQDLFQLLSHESVQTAVSEDGVATKVGEGIVCTKKPTPQQNFAYECTQWMDKKGDLLPGAFTSPDDDFFDRLQYSRIIINGMTASKLYRFLNIKPLDHVGILGKETWTERVKFGQRIACSERIYESGRPTEYQCGQRLKTNGVARGAGDWEVGGSITVGNMIYYHESRD